jgi:hypothetical protein
VGAWGAWGDGGWGNVGLGRIRQLPALSVQDVNWQRLFSTPQERTPMAASFLSLHWQLHGLMVIIQFLARYEFCKPASTTSYFDATIRDLG